MLPGAPRQARGFNITGLRAANAVETRWFQIFSHFEHTPPFFDVEGGTDPPG
jgi:hypothetical protein